MLGCILRKTLLNKLRKLVLYYRKITNFEKKVKTGIMHNVHKNAMQR